jgi:hypothetical protein
MNHHDSLTYENIYVAADLHCYNYAKHEGVRGEAEGCILDALRCLAISHDLCQVIVNNLVYSIYGLTQPHSQLLAASVDFSRLELAKKFSTRDRYAGNASEIRTYSKENPYSSTLCSPLKQTIHSTLTLLLRKQSQYWPTTFCTLAMMILVLHILTLTLVH